MAKIKLARSLGRPLISELGLDTAHPEKYLEGEEVSVPADAEKELRKRSLVADETAEVRGVATAPAVRGVPEESPVSDTNAAEAIEAVGRMTSKDKLQHVIDNDPRVTVKEAAKKRLASL